MVLKMKIFCGFAALASVFFCLASTGWAVNCTCNKPGALQACINSNPSASTITVVGPATCYENLTLAQSLVANNTNGKVVIEAADSNKPVISVAGTGRTFISGLTITGGTIGIDWNLGHGMVYNNTIQNCSVAGINAGGGAYLLLGASTPSDVTSSPNTIMNCPIGVMVTSHSGAGILGNTITSCKTAGVQVDSSSQADLAGNTIDSCTNAISVSENSSIRLSDRPSSILPLWGLLNKTDATAKNTGPAILCTTGGAVRGYEGALTGSTPVSADSTCIQNLKTNSSPLSIVPSYSGQTESNVKGCPAGWTLIWVGGNWVCVPIG
jgi:hypothetical protein